MLINFFFTLGGGVNDDDDDEGRDWLDYIYATCRVAIMLTMLYYYSTLYRFMFVICTGMIIFL